MKKKKQSTAAPVILPPLVAKPVVKIVITEEDGQIQVDGPVGNKILMYGLLALAMDAVRDGKLIQ